MGDTKGLPKSHEIDAADTRSVRWLARLVRLGHGVV